MFVFPLFVSALDGAPTCLLLLAADFFKRRRQVCSAVSGVARAVGSPKQQLLHKTPQNTGLVY